MDAIKKWLDNKKAKLKDGALLLKKHGTAGQWGNYTRARSSDKRLLLTGALTRIWLDHQKAEQKPQTNKNTSVSDKLRAEFAHLDFNSLPEKLQVLVIRRYSLFETAKERYQAQHKAESDQERFEAADAAIEAYAENNEIWNELHHYQVNHKLLGRSRHFKVDPFEAMLDRMQREMNAVELGAAIATKMKHLRGEIGRHKGKGDTDKMTNAIARYDRMATIIGAEAWANG